LTPMASFRSKSASDDLAGEYYRESVSQ